MEIIFRIATIYDYDALCVLKKQVHDYHSLLIPDFYRKVELPFTRNEFDGLLENNDNSIYVVESGRRIAGYAITRAISFKANPLIVNHARLFIEDIFIDPVYRRMGLGNFLLENLKSVCRSEGYSHLDLNVWSFNTEAIAFFRKMGMREIILRMECSIA